jgi:membrane protease subunit (stomatin/prohibitin family)
MGMWDGVKRQLRSVIEWDAPGADELFFRWSENGDEIKNASKLIVGPGQGCIFVYEGQVVSVIEQEGMTSLLTENIPFWTTVTKFMQAFESEHKVGLYFFKKTRILDQKWGTMSPIKYDDPKYQFPVALMAYGNYSFKIEDAKSFFVNVLGGQESYRVEDFREMMLSRVNQPIGDFLATAQYSYAQIDAQREEISQALELKLQADFLKLGFSLTDFRIEGTDFDEDTKGRISKIADIAADAHGADIAGVSYAELQRLEAMKDAANNEVGAAGLMMGMGVGSGLAGTTMQSDTPQPAVTDVKSRLSQLKELFDAKLISEEEYTQKKSDILKDL